MLSFFNVLVPIEITDVSVSASANSASDEVEFVCDVRITGVQQDETVLLEIEWLVDQAVAHAQTYNLNDNIILTEDKWGVGQQVSTQLTVCIC